jgi:hypothetical protein
MRPELVAITGKEKEDRTLDVRVQNACAKTKASAR